MSILSRPEFHDEQAAYDYVEARIWPHGATCPKCGERDRVSKMGGKSTRIGAYKCYKCRKPFTVKVGTIFESSHVKMNIWLQAIYLMCASKKGISSQQLHRTLGVTLKTAWFVSHRIREAMRTDGTVSFGNDGGVVEVDETFIGQKHKKKEGARGYAHKNAMLSLVDRTTGLCCTIPCRDSLPESSMIAGDMSSWHPTKYKTTNWSAYNDALKQRGSLTIWFDPGMTWRPPPTGKRGRQQQFSDAAIQTCLTMKVLFGMPLRQTTGFVESLLQPVGLDWAVPDFSTLCRRQRILNVELPYRGGTGPLNLLIDSTGIKAEGEGEWNARKHGGSKRRIWRKIHIGIDEETLEVRAVEVTTSNVGDAPMLPELLDQILLHQDIGSVTADGTYDTRKCHDAIANRGAHAVIPPRKNAKPWKPTSAGAVARNEAVNTSRYLGRALWRRWSGYHRRSRVETKMHCMKLMGQSLMARDFERQVAEIQIRIAVLNRYTALGIPVTEPVA